MTCSGQCWDSMHSLNRFPQLHIVVCVCVCVCVCVVVQMKEQFHEGIIQQDQLLGSWHRRVEDTGWTTYNLSKKDHCTQ